MLIFILAIFCLTMSNLPWFLELTFQVLVQFCSSQHQTLLSPRDICTTERHFCFGPFASLFLELLLIAICFFPLAYWTLSNLGSSYSSIISFCLFIVDGVLSARILEVFAISSSSRPCFVRTLHYDPSIVGGLAWHGSLLHWVIQAIAMTSHSWQAHFLAWDRMAGDKPLHRFLCFPQKVKQWKIFGSRIDWTKF